MSSSFDIDTEKALVDYISYIKAHAFEGIATMGATVGSVVMNCNPFTNGHKYLIEQVATRCDFVYIFVVEEDRSFFSFEDRLMLVKEGISHLKNVKVLPGGKFIISTVTFPEYFTKDAAKEVTINAVSDVEIFAKYIAKPLGITKRFAGTEPLCNVTRQYNNTMRTILPKYGIEFEVFDRITYQGEPISASRVRLLMEQGDFESISKLVPNSTLLYLNLKKS